MKAFKQISYSQYNMFQSCPHSWKLVYRDGIRKERDSRNAIEGIVLQRILEWFLKYEKSREWLFDFSSLVHVYNYSLKRDPINLKPGETHKEIQLDIYDLILPSYDFLKSHDYFSKNAKSEEKISAEISDGIKLSSQIDFITFLEDGTIKLVDLKASKHGMKYISYDQLMIYYWAVELKYGRCPVECGFFLVRDSEYRSLFDEAEIFGREKLFRDNIIKTAKFMRDAEDTEFKASYNRNGACRWCDVKEHCKEFLKYNKNEKLFMRKGEENGQD